MQTKEVATIFGACLICVHHVSPYQQQKSIILYRELHF